MLQLVSPSICPSIHLSYFLIQCCLLDGGMRMLLFQTHSIGESMVGYACIHMLLAGGKSLRCMIPCCLENAVISDKNPLSVSL